MYQDNKSLLMNVDDMNFVNDLDEEKDTGFNNESDLNMDTSDESIEGNESIQRDPATGDLVAKLTSTKFLPLKQGQNGKLKFKLNSLVAHNIAYLSEKDAYKLYPVAMPNIDNTIHFSNYVYKLFEIYQDLGEHRSYSIPTIGLINSSYQSEHRATVNLAMEALVSELEFFIESAKAGEISIDRYHELEESLTILHCLKTIHFSLDTPDKEEIRSSFIAGLLEWVNRSDGEPDSEFIGHVFSSNGEQKSVFKNNIFWKLLNKLLLRGLFDQALGCIERSRIVVYLESTCKVSFDAMNDLIELIKQYPIDSDNTFREWKSTVLELSQTFSNSETNVSGELRDHMEDTLLLVSGDRSKILNYSKTWYESFCGFFLYYIPTLELAGDYLKLAIERNPMDVTNSWEECCVDIIKGNIHSIFPVLESLDNCTATFTAGICEAKGLLGSLYSNEADDISLIEKHQDGLVSGNFFSLKDGIAYYMINNFAFELCTYDNKQLWSIAIGLISLVPTNTTSAKRLTIGELLQHYPYQTNDDIEWLLSICAKWKLPYVAKSLFTKLGSSMMYEGKTIEAMTNFSKAGKFDLMQQYSWTLFEASVINGNPLEDEILTAIVKGSNFDSSNRMIISEEILANLVTNAMRQTLAPYAVLYQFYEARANEDWSTSLDMLMALIKFEYLPDYYLVMLITKFLYPIFLSDNTKPMKESVVIDIIESIETKWNSDNIKAQNIYQAVLDMDESIGKLLPEDLNEVLLVIRQKLNFKLCQEFM